MFIISITRLVVLHISHCVKNVCIRNFSGPYFPVFGLNMKIYCVNLRIQSEYMKISVFTRNAEKKTDRKYSEYGHLLRSVTQ